MQEKYDKIKRLITGADGNMKERLDKILASQNIGSRKDVGLLIRKGAITVNGLVVKKSDTKVDGDLDEICVNGISLQFKRHLYLMMNKPAGVLSAARDSRMQTVLDLLPEVYRRRGLFPAGRLDRDTEGLLIITDDGDFAHKMLSPKSNVFKVYHAKLDAPVTDEDIAAFETGIVVGDLQCLPAHLERLEKEGEPWAKVTICEGKFHQVKRMFLARGKQVVYLERIQIGNLQLDTDLHRGETRELTEQERTAIFHK